MIDYGALEAQGVWWGARVIPTRYMDADGRQVFIAIVSWTLIIPAFNIVSQEWA